MDDSSSHLEWMELIIHMPNTHIDKICNKAQLTKVFVNAKGFHYSRLQPNLPLPQLKMTILAKMSYLKHRPHPGLLWFIYDPYFFQAIYCWSWHLKRERSPNILHSMILRFFWFDILVLGQVCILCIHYFHMWDGHKRWKYLCSNVKFYMMY